MSTSFEVTFAAQVLGLCLGYIVTDRLDLPQRCRQWWRRLNRRK